MRGAESCLSERLEKAFCISLRRNSVAPIGDSSQIAAFIWGFMLGLLDGVYSMDMQLKRGSGSSFG